MSTRRAARNIYLPFLAEDDLPLAHHGRLPCDGSGDSFLAGAPRNGGGIFMFVFASTCGCLLSIFHEPLR